MLRVVEHFLLLPLLQISGVYLINSLVMTKGLA